MIDNRKIGEDFDSTYTAVDRAGIPGGYVEPPVAYTDFDPAYKAVDRHGMPKESIVESPVTYTEFDDEYLAVDRHGMPESSIAESPVTVTDFDDEYLAVDRHGMPGGYVGTPGYHTEFDQQYLDVDRHGIPGEWKSGRGPISMGYDQGYLDVDRHGIPGGWANPDQDDFQTDDDEIIQFCKDVVDALDITEAGYLEIAKLSDVQIKKIIELRHRKTAVKISKDDTTDIEKQLYTDLNIIYKMIMAKKNLYDNDIKLSYLIGGENYTNIVGVLSSYEQLISNLMIRSKATFLDKIRLLKEDIINNNIEFDSGERRL